MSGTLYGLGLGPGDPELLTLKAHRLISQAKVIAYPAPDSGESFARSIVAGYIPEGVREIPIVIPMRSERFPAQEVYDAAAEDIASVLETGQDVIVLCEGDPFFYGSFMYLFSRLADRFPTEVVPGVSSLGAVTAAAGLPLIARDEVLTVLPATLPAPELEAQVRKSNAVAIMKLGRQFAKVRSLLEGLGLADRAVFVSHASLPEQMACPLAEAPETAPYFSMVVVPGRDAHV
ncbi:precorrin-2 C(20)-methyltransferase [Tropicimonas isoalkanivorans]|uniref:Precorrin-2/cobalt-factor-2 C20-methyltransferase n=1 Tax=Tropicimonas isoalkanivorans TaxID=441112 RepID=A0A1I1LN85_9RHOB|nr:precorrin-2 C(20)-methyltransferase [Tropicimonas isoalkanivorans]SFC70930.1 precorrin-2/cobalt-factor-2 C20-methyltransferase [Tropicimonas isoalkanivorans]